MRLFYRMQLGTATAMLVAAFERMLSDGAQHVTYLPR